MFPRFSLWSRRFQPQGRWVGGEQLLLCLRLRILQELCGLHTGAKQLQIHRFIIRHGAFPFPDSGDSLPGWFPDYEKEEAS